MSEISSLAGELTSFKAIKTEPNECHYNFSTSNDDNYFSTTNLCLGGELIDVPNELIMDPSIFRQVLTKKAFWELSDRAREHLKDHLPVRVRPGTDELDEMLNCIFTEDENFCFGSPISKMFKKIQSGDFSLPQAAIQVRLREHHRVLYDHNIRRHHMKLLKKLLINRHKILEEASRLNQSDRLQIDPRKFYSQRKLAKSVELQKRAKLRAKRMIMHCKKQVGIDEPLSSDDSSPEPDESDIPVAVSSSTTNTLYSKKFSQHDIGLHQPIRNKTVKEMILEYKRLKETESDCPSLDMDVTLEEVYQRCDISFQSERNFAQMVGKKHEKNS